MSDDYEIGYKKPPRHTQFKPGESGNRAGRPRKRKADPAHDPASILTEPVRVRSNGQMKEMSGLEVGLRKKVQEALKTSSARKLLKAIDMFDKEGLIRRPQEQKFVSVLVFPRRWDANDFYEKFKIAGPPPWDGPDDGLPYETSQTHPFEEYKRQCVGDNADDEW